MWATSPAFDAALVRDRRIATQVDVLSGGKTITTLDVVMSGTVTAEDAAVRRSGTVQLIDPKGTLTPVTANDMLAPHGTELRLSKGLYLPGVTAPEMVPLGTLLISKPVISRNTSGLVIDVNGYDRMRAVKRARFKAPWQVPAGTLVTTAISDIVTSRTPYPVNVTPAVNVTPELVFEQLSDPGDALQQLVDSISYEMFFDVLGTFVARPVPAYESLTPAWTYERSPDGLLLADSRTLDDQNAYSGVIVTAEHPDLVNPIRVEVWDTDPGSPTYYDPAFPALSLFGPVPYGFASPILTTTGQATLAGQTIGQRVFGLQEIVEIETIGHFGHDVGDAIVVRDPVIRLTGTSIIQKVVQPIRRGSMTITMRSRRAVQV